MTAQFIVITKIFTAKSSGEIFTLSRTTSLAALPLRDGIAITKEDSITITALEDSELVLVDAA